ncbi:acyl-CoA dehydrogenase family protein [Streptomyces sp. PDY-4]|uniref:acyl-CoA dehydrogenase family protein n=1 Tax=Streptomyces sp. PDY-4 TaxID=3376070 RepID=UPI00378AB7D7
MSWHGPALDSDQRDLMAMLDAFAADHDLVLTDEPEAVARLTAELVELGVWTLGTAEEHGGGGADRTTTVIALERLGRTWPALGWACAQAHAAIDVLASDERCADLVGRVHAGTAAVAVVDAGSAHVRLTRSGTTLSGSVDRIDAAAEAPHLLVLADEDRALLIDPAALTYRPLRRTGLGGALTRSPDVEAGVAEVTELTGVDVPAAQVRLRLGAAAVAAGTAAAAADTAAAYSAGRQQFGDALTALPTVRQSLLAQASGSAIALAAAVAVADDPVRSLSAAREACDGAITVAAAALQSHGGYGYLAEYPAERYLRDAVSLRAAADLQGAAVTTARTLVGLAPGTSLRKDG